MTGAGGAAPKVAILGAGPVGLDAALAVAERGWPFVLYEAGERAAASVAAWGHVQMFSPWSMNVSSRMRRILERAGRSPPDHDSDGPTGRELVAQVLEPLATLEPLASRLRTRSRVVAVARDGLVKDDAIGNPARGGRPFRILVRERGQERVDRAEVILDCTGTWGHPNALGSGGIPAPGEEEVDDLIVRHVPDVAANEGRWEGKRILLVGGGHSACTAVRDLARHAEVVWAVRGSEVPAVPDPDDPLPERRRLAEAVRETVREQDVELHFGSVVERLERVAPRAKTTSFGRRGATHAVRVTLSGSGRPAGSAEGDAAATPRRADRVEVEVDRIVSLTGYVGDASLYRQLQVHECYATSGPMKLAASLLATGSGDCLEQPAAGPEVLRTPEPGFFLLGSKSYGRNNTFLLRDGWRQVEQVMGLIDPSSQG